MSDDKSVPMAEIEQAAKQQGWSPEKGDLSPLEFLAKGREFRDRLYDDVKALRTENEKLYGVVSEHIASVKKKETVSETEKVEAEIRKATEDGDPDKVLELTKKLKPAADPVDDPNIKFIETWKSSNKWFGENAEMQSEALGFYQAEKIRLGVDNPQAILPEVEKKMKKFYPDYFKAKNHNEERDSGAEKGGRKPSKKSGISESDLDEAESKHFNDFVKLGLDPKKLLRSIENERARRG